MRIFFARLVAFAFIALMGCSTTGPVVMTEVECELDGDCDVGSYCDSFSNLCGYDCRSDAECELGMYCAINGQCIREEVPPPIESPVLEIVAGEQWDLTLASSAINPELVRFTVRNIGDRPIEVPSIHIGGHFTGGESLDNVLGLTVIRDERSLRTVAGPLDLSHGAHGFGTRFEDSFVIEPGQEMLLAVRTDLLGASASFDIILGNTVELFDELRFADTLEAVADEDVLGNFSIVRHINVLSEEAIATVPGVVSVFMPDSGGRRVIDSGTEVDTDTEVFHITVANTTEEEVRFGDLRITVVTDDGRPWAEDGFVPFRSIMVYDSRDGSWLFAPPGASGCGTNGCTFIYDGPTLAPGETTTLAVRVRIATAGRQYQMLVGQSFSSTPGMADAGAIFHSIRDTTGTPLPADVIVGNQPGFYHVSSR